MYRRAPSISIKRISYQFEIYRNNYWKRKPNFRDELRLCILPISTANCCKLKLKNHCLSWIDFSPEFNSVRFFSCQKKYVKIKIWFVRKNCGWALSSEHWYLFIVMVSRVLTDISHSFPHFITYFWYVTRSSPIMLPISKLIEIDEIEMKW